jgi:hypothetical protein
MNHRATISTARRMNDQSSIIVSITIIPHSQNINNATSSQHHALDARQQKTTTYNNTISKNNNER